MRTSKPYVERAEVVPRPSASVVAVAEWIIQRELLWLALLSPFLLFPDRWWVWLAALLPVLWIVRFVARGRFLPGTPLDWPITLLTIMVAVSLSATFSIDVSLPKVTGVLLGVGLYYGLVEWADTRERTRRVVWGYAIAGVGLAVVSLLGTNWIDKMQSVSSVTHDLPRVVSGLPGAESGFHPNEVAGALLWAGLPVVALAVWAWAGRHLWRERVMLSMACILITLTLVLTQSRGALTGAVVGMALLFFMLMPRLRVWLVGAILLLLAIFVASDPGAIANKLLEPTVPGYGTTDPANARVRFDIWSSALSAIGDAPLTGIGMNTFRYIMPERYPAALVPPGYDVAHAHNVLLQVALDLGLPGMLAFLAMNVIAVVLLVRTWRATNEYWQRAVVAGIGAGLLAFFVFGINDTIALGAKPGIFFWALLAIAVMVWVESRKSKVEGQ